MCLDEVKDNDIHVRGTETYVKWFALDIQVAFFPQIPLLIAEAKQEYFYLFIYI